MDILRNRDFTLTKYEQLCQSIAGSDYTNVTFYEYLTRKVNDGKRFIILRHDIDRDARYALSMAEIEHKLNLKASYYFRMRKKAYVPAIMDSIAGYGHEIGYHYENVDRCHGDLESALKLFEKELSLFRQRYPVKTVCMHGNPLTPYDNKAIWQKKKLADFDLLGEPYLSLDYARFAYFSDSGRAWSHEARIKTKDRINIETQPEEHPKKTDELIQLIGSGKPRSMCILTHPERWSKNLIDYTQRYFIDLLYTAGKTALWMLRSPKAEAS